MKIFAQLVEVETGKRTEAVSGTKEQLATIFYDEWNSRQRILERLSCQGPIEFFHTAQRQANLAVLILMEDAQSPADFRFSTAPVMTVSAFHRWVFPPLDLDKVVPDLHRGVDDAVSEEKHNFPQVDSVPDQVIESLVWKNKEQNNG